MQKKPRKGQVTAWLDAQTDEDAWLTYTYQEIADAISTPDDTVAPTTVRRHIAFIMAERLGVEPSEIVERKKAYRVEYLDQMTPNKLRQLKEWREQGVPLMDCAYRLNMSISTIVKHCEKLGLLDNL